MGDGQAKVLFGDDSPFKTTMAPTKTVNDFSASHKGYAIGSALNDFSDAQISKQVAAMKLEGFGSKPRREIFTLLGDRIRANEQGEEEFWENQFTYWKNNVRGNLISYVDFEFLVGVDLLESFLNRLTSYYKDKQYLSSIFGVNFEPFTARLDSISYREVLRYTEEYDAGTQRELCIKALDHAENSFVDDLRARGLELPDNLAQAELCSIIRAECQDYLKSLVKHGRNMAAHLFTTAIYQNGYTRDCCNIYCTAPHATIWALTDLVKVSRRKIEELLNILEHFQKRAPGELTDFSTIFHLQVLFLLSVFKDSLPPVTQRDRDNV